MNKSLLLDENPLLVMPKLAALIGLNEAIILQQIHYWIAHNEKTRTNLKDGYYWTFNSYEQWKDQFPFYSVKTIIRTMANLESLGLIITSNYNRMKIDRTKWYRIDYKRLETIETCPFGQNDQINRTIWLNQVDSLTNTIPETNTKINKENNILLHRKTPSQYDNNIKAFIKAYNDTFDAEHRLIIKEYNNIYKYDPADIYLMACEFMKDYTIDKCSIDYFEKVIDRYKGI